MVNTIVETKYGKISGIEKEGYVLYAGIPYAKPPVNELRWKAPQELEAWNGIYAADHFGKTCIQKRSTFREFYGKEFYDEHPYFTELSEDCLYLNVWTPKQEEDAKLPVAFYIHGGAFLNGYGHEKEFDGEAYTKRNVILVTINYRLGVWGFLAHPWLSEENERHISGNYGTMDQLAALKWIYENISAFGGDPNNITVFGQSAGGMSTRNLVSTEKSGDMISKAIIQSGLGLGFDKYLSEAEAEGLKFSEAAQAHSLEELRSLPADAVFEIANQMIDREFKEKHRPLYVPVIDGYLFGEGDDKLPEKGRIKHIPYIVGSNKNDIGTSEESVQKPEKGLMYHANMGWCDAINSVSDAPVYMYYFTRDLPGDAAGAFHSAELWYVFGTLNRCWRPLAKEDYRLSGEILDYWTTFMKTGKPVLESDDSWKPYKSDHFVKVLDI